MTHRICTVGHSTRGLDEMLELLADNEVTCLVDVRSFPSSRAFPQWDQQALVDGLPPEIGYRWIRELGGRRHTPKGVASVNDGWRVKAFRAYADHMATQEFRAGLDELLDLAANERPAIMCSEAVPWRCHRRLITDALIVEGVEVVDILARTSVRPASLTDFARVVDGVLTYPAPEDTPDERDPGSVVDRVRAAVSAIPAGRVASYGDIGDRVGTTARQVGRVMADLDDGVPWWRVVHADGSPPTCHDGQAGALLRAEGTPLRRTRVDMERARLR